MRVRSPSPALSGNAQRLISASATLIPAATVSAVLTPYVDAANPHANAPEEAPSHTINIASDDPRPRTQLGNCSMYVEIKVFSIAIVPMPQMSIAATAIHI
ncbi:MAG: hypothetical protein WCJ08_06565 [bacterium]